MKEKIDTATLSVSGFGRNEVKIKFKGEVQMSKQLDCGCVVGYYWCNKHDIYTKQAPNDPPHRVRDYEDEKPSFCSCHISAPCSFCVNQ